MFMEILDQIPAPVSISPTPRFTDKQGQYLAFIYMYTLINRQPPAEADVQQFFRVTPPSFKDTFRSRTCCALESLAVATPQKNMTNAICIKDIFITRQIKVGNGPWPAFNKCPAGKTVKIFCINLNVCFCS